MRRAQSETIGFVVVFAIVVASVAVVSTAGFGTLVDAQRGQQTANAERAMDVFADNVEDIAHRGAPSRGTELKLAGDAVELGDPVHVNVTAEATGSTANVTYNRSVVPLVYRAGDTRIVYAMGAVFRTDPGGTVVVREPTLRLDADRAVVQVLATRDGGLDSVGGASTVHVRAVSAERSLVYASESPHEVTVRVTGDRAAAWGRILEARGATCTPDGARTVVCRRTADAVHVSVVRIDLLLE